MVYFCNMDYDSDSGKWWIDAFYNWPSYETTRTFYDTEADAYVFYNSIINKYSAPSSAGSAVMGNQYRGQQIMFE